MRGAWFERGCGAAFIAGGSGASGKLSLKAPSPADSETRTAKPTSQREAEEDDERDIVGIFVSTERAGQT